MIVQRRSLKMVWHSDGLPSVELNVSEKIFSLNELKTKFRYAFVERVRKLSSHEPQKPSEDRPNRQGIAEHLTLALVTANEIHECFLLIGGSFTSCILSLQKNLVVVIEMEDSLRKKWKFGVVKRLS